METETPPLNFMEYGMRKFVYDSWNSVMDADKNPLRHIPDLNTRHLVLQVLAWMWCIVFAIIVGSWTVFGISAVVHVILLAAIAITVGTFEVARKNPAFFIKKNGYHSFPRARQTMWINGEKVKLDKNDPGGEHE